MDFIDVSLTMFSVPDWAHEVPGVWPFKKGNGARVPMNVTSLLDRSLPYEDGADMLAEILNGPMYHEWLGEYLMPHQKKILTRALPRKGFNAWAPPGSGKTLCGCVWLGGAGRGPKVVITKAAARGTWKEEVRKYTNYVPVVLSGQKSRTIPGESNCIYIIGWETLIWWKDALVELGIHSLVMDEIHWAKNPKRVRGVVQKDGTTEWVPLKNASAAAVEVARSATRRFGLTATPIPNRPKDLWAQLDLVEPWQWGTFHQFGVRYCDGFKDTYGWKYDGLSGQIELGARLKWSKHKTSQRAISSTLPAKRRQIVYLDKDEQNAPSGFKNDIRRAGKTGDREAMFEVLLQEAASRKRKYVVNRAVEAAASGQKVTVFTGRRKDCEKIGEAIAKATDVPVWCAHGGASADQRDGIRKEYMESKCGILVGTGAAWGESVNLQDTDLALFVMLPWTPREVRQWEGRFSRLGQARPVLISYVIAKNTVDEHVSDLLIDKLPAVGSVAEDEILMEVEEAFTETQEDLLSRIAEV